MKVVFDIDGTLADITHRLGWIADQPKNWKAFEKGCINDAPIMHIVNTAISMHEQGHRIRLASGRSEDARQDTVSWLTAHGISFYEKLHMRRSKDYRPDYIVKSEILDEMIGDGFTPDLAVDDRNQVVEMWRERGIACIQVAKGDF